MNRKRISVFLVTCILLSLFSTSVSAIVSDTDFPIDVVGESSGTCGDSASWTLSDGGMLTISGVGAMSDFESDNEVPWYDSRLNVLSVVVQSGITHVGDLSFYGCENVKTITLGKDVATIGDNAFFACISLTAIDVHSSNTVYKSSSGALYSKDGKTLISCPNGKSGEYTVLDSVEVIGEHAFQYCIKLTGISTGDNVSTVGNGAFSACSALKSVIIGKNVSVLGDGIFSYCIALTDVEVSEQNEKFSSIDGIVYSKDGKTLVCCPCGKEGELVISSSTESVAKYAFYKCSLLTSITIPDNVTSVGEYAFSYCEGITSLKIGKGLRSIAKEAFSYCTSLPEVTIGENVETIGNYAFYSCEELKKVVFSDSVVEIGRYCFQRCYKLREVDFGSGITTIGGYAFCQCNQLLSVTIPESVTSIGFKALGFTVKGSSYTYYAVEGFTIYGAIGSAAEAYATKNSFAFVEYVPSPEPQPDITELPDNDYYLNTADLTMPNLVAKTTVSQIVSALSEYGVSVTVADKGGNALAETDIVGTGCKVTASDGNTYTVIVVGDVDGSGIVDSTDYLRIKSMFLGTLTLDGVYNIAADADESGKIDSTDYLRIKSYFLGTLDLYA